MILLASNFIRLSIAYSVGASALGACTLLSRAKGLCLLTKRACTQAKGMSFHAEGLRLAQSLCFGGLALGVAHSAVA